MSAGIPSSRVKQFPRRCVGNSVARLQLTAVPELLTKKRDVAAGRASQRWPNLTLKKIPKMVLARCEWGHDDYSLNVANLPMAATELAGPHAKGGPHPSPLPQAGEGASQGKGRKKRTASATPDLFGNDGEGGAHGDET